MFPGLPSRIQKDLSDKFNEQIKAGTRTETKTRLNIIVRFLNIIRLLGSSKTKTWSIFRRISVCKCNEG